MFWYQEIYFNHCGNLPLCDIAFQLDLSLKIRLLRSIGTFHYTFEPKPIAFDRIDILESRLRDHLGTTSFLYVESEAMVDSKLQWKEVTAEAFALNEDKTSFTILVPGLYSIRLVVNHIPITNMKVVLSLQMALQSVVTESFYAHSITTSSSLKRVLQIEKDGNLSVLCTANVTPKNTIKFDCYAYQSLIAMFPSSRYMDNRNTAYFLYTFTSSSIRATSKTMFRH
ncbi:hypothetical protein P3T76_006066 [Phytophthora citrophthora]|uniref:Uncharacterized protein n=1 Tax=Phytophthora citrophthora TaxID=4793 RepID=A0AAD9GPZ7_9STRA|nr:hypothetical protein P3T76_006066 [Phytophthora citrophthora]